MKILFQGDSVTDAGRTSGADPASSLGKGYPLFVSGYLGSRYPDKGFEVVNRGISGNRIVDLYGRWKADALNLRPDLISILVGVNDTWHERASQNGVEPERFERVYRELLAWTLKTLPEVKLVLCEPFMLPFGAAGDDWVDEMKERDAIVRDLSLEFGALFVPFQHAIDDAAGRAEGSHWLLDGVHPTCSGHAILADAWLEAVASLLEI